MKIKNLIYSLFVCGVALSAVSCMKIDNWDAPDARISGRIIDKNTGEPILASQGEYNVRLYEMSFSNNPDPFDVPVKQDGTYNNHRIFAGTYDAVLEGPWWPVDRITGIPVGKKGTDRDFEVLPYYTLTDFTTSLDTTSDPGNPTLTMSCRLGVSLPDRTPLGIGSVRPMLSLNQFCGSTNKLDYYNTDTYRIAGRVTWASIEKDAEGKALMKSKPIPVKPGYIYFVRIGVEVLTTPVKYSYTEIKMIEVPQ